VLIDNGEFCVCIESCGFKNNNQVIDIWKLGQTLLENL